MPDYHSLPKGYSLRLVLIRHGEPEQQPKPRCYGRLDIALSERGRVQIQSKVSSIKGITAEALYTSPSKRAFETAEIAGAWLQLEPNVTDSLQEINFGKLEGLSYDQIEELYPQEYRLWMEHPAKIKFPDGESFAEMKSRVVGFQDFALRAHTRETVVVVSHGGTNRILIGTALGVPDECIFRIDQAYGAINIIDYFDTYPVVRLVNG